MISGTAYRAAWQGRDGVPPDLFDFIEVAPDRFRVPATGGPLQRLFGGHVLAQALSAAQRTVPPGKVAHSCHAYFVRAGRVDAPIDFVVTRDSDGRSFAMRRVMAMQAGALILSLSASMHVQEEGPIQQFSLPDVPPPEALPPLDEVIAATMAQMPLPRQAFWDRDLGLDFRAVEPFVTVDPPVSPSHRHFWVKVRQPLGDDPVEHQCMLAYLSDLFIMHTGLGPLGLSWASPRLQDASLDHAIWFHQRVRADEWLLCMMDSPFAGGARTLGRSTVFTRDGRLVASVAQEGLIRILPEETS